MHFESGPIEGEWLYIYVISPILVPKRILGVRLKSLILYELHQCTYRDGVFIACMCSNTDKTC